MGKNTGISWTGTRRKDGSIAPGHTFNAWIGCTKVNAECANCYAETWDKIYMGGDHWGPGASRRIMPDKYWNDPIRWNRAAVKAGEIHKVFCSSLADVFDKEAPAGQRERLWPLIKATPNLIWLLLTKRPENALEMLPSDWGDGYENVWIGTTTGTQASFDRNYEYIKNIPAKYKFLSVEPQLEEIDFSKAFPNPVFDWIIFGGESGAKSRTFDPDWMKKPIEQSKEAGVAVFVKQMGTVWAKENDCSSKKAGDPEEWPEWARIWEWPDEVSTMTEKEHTC